MHKEIIISPHTNTNINNGNHNVIIMVALYTHNNIIVFEFIPYHHCIL